MGAVPVIMGLLMQLANCAELAEDGLSDASFFGTLGLGTVIAAVSGLVLGSITVGVLAFNPGDPHRRKAKRSTKQPHSPAASGGVSGCPCCH